MKKFILLLVLISFTAYSQNRFTGTWSTENCKDCSKKYILKLNIAQSVSQIYGTAEIVSDDKELNSGIMEITGYVYVLGDRAQIKIKSKDGGLSASAVLVANDGAMQFNKRGGSDLIPKETILTKLYD
ncbi:hypothetical protein CLU81_5330 [Flavobacterium sp. 9]|uniref:hypothetical protein n=1 Tax=Flavobacterium sp. 9 TaxID=2035198 RepID=UPI000C1A5DEF|nr:hypothetical protein [Flavobacterium sp. 9]PIF34669.1 hypothetical protein CLU81_5330 [Flavobacterium sp. 9]